MNKKNAMPWWGWFAWILIVLFGVIAYLHLPSQIPTKAGHTTSRLFAVWYEPTLILVIMLLWHVLWRIDPKKGNYEGFWATYRYVGGVIVICIGLVYLTVLGHLLHMGSLRLIPTVVGIMLMLIANVLPRLQPNWWLGVRTPWTLSNEQSWRRTHRLSGQLGIPMGILIIILAWILPMNKALLLAVLIPLPLWLIIIVIASYYYAKSES